MNILFITSYYPDPRLGGIERVTNIIGKKLKQDGHNVFYLHLKVTEYDNNDSDIISLIIDPKASSDLLHSFIVDNNVDFIINQSHFFYTPNINDARKGTNAKLFTFFHNSPYFKSLPLNEAIKSCHNKIKCLFIILFFPFYKFITVYKLKKEHRISYQLSDKTILLSSLFIDDYCKKLKINKREKLEIVSNPLSFEYNFTDKDFLYKEKIVLIVSQLSEIQKKLTLALKIWKRIESSGINNWKLIVVGDGPDKNMYINFAEKLKLRNVEFVGRQLSFGYFKRSSIFIMTSKFEGFGITLIESLQMACVPVGMAGLGPISEIIDNGNDGFIVKYKDIKSATARILDLIKDDHLREKMAKNGIISSERFALSNIIKQWYQILK
jgi:glycosyltransferase involved in cell wall biosynthesis